MSLLAITFMLPFHPTEITQSLANTLPHELAADCFLQMEALQLPRDNTTMSYHTLLAHLTQQNKQVAIQTLHRLTQTMESAFYFEPFFLSINIIMCSSPARWRGKNIALSNQPFFG